MPEIHNILLQKNGMPLMQHKIIFHIKYLIIVLLQRFFVNFRSSGKTFFDNSFPQHQTQRCNACLLVLAQHNFGHFHKLNHINAHMN
jgi:hypothetical protein